MYDGDIVNLIDDDIMLSGVDRDCPIVIDVEDKVTTISEEYCLENLYKLILRTMKSLIGETSNCATTYHNKIAKSKEQQTKYEKYIDLLSIVNGKAVDFAKTGILYNIPRHIAIGGKPLPYFMKYRSEYYSKQKNLSKSWSNMNHLCYDIEKWQKKNIKFKRTYKDFDYSIMINDKVSVTLDHYEKIEKIFLEFCNEINELSKEQNMLKDINKYKDYFDSMYPDQSYDDLKVFTVNWEYYYSMYRSKCKAICPNKQELANIAVKLCYEKYTAKNKKFMWKVAGDGILLNLKQNDISLPKRDDGGDIVYLGRKYKSMEVLRT